MVDRVELRSDEPGPPAGDPAARDARRALSGPPHQPQRPVTADSSA